MAVEKHACPYGQALLVLVDEPGAHVCLYTFGVDGPGWLLRLTALKRTARRAPDEAADSAREPRIDGGAVGSDDID